MPQPLIIDALQYSKPTRARFEEWAKGGVGCVHVTLAIWENARDTLSVIGEWNQLFKENADLIELARTADDVTRISASGKTAVVLGFQNTSPLEDDIELVRIFHDLGIRIIQLTYNIQNQVAAGCWEDTDPGLSTHLGRNLVREMNDVGMLVDLSHCGPKSTMDAIEFSDRPVAITHANPVDFVGQDVELNRRSKSTDIIKALAERGGVIGLSPYPRINRGGSDATLADFCDMVAWTVDAIGPDAVGFGTDYYVGYPESMIKWWRAGRWARESPVPIQGGLTQWPSWFQDPSQFPGVIDGLRRRGLAEGDIEKIAGGNWLRLFGASFTPARAAAA